MMGAFTQDFIIQPAGKKKHKAGAMDVPARLWNPDGTPFTGGSAAPTADTLAGATDTGKSVLKATDAAAARKAIGAGTSSFSGAYADLSGKPTIPTAPTWANISGRPTAAQAIPDLASDADTATIVATVNKMLAAQRAYGIIAS